MNGRYFTVNLQCSTTVQPQRAGFFFLKILSSSQSLTVFLTGNYCLFLTSCVTCTHDAKKGTVVYNTKISPCLDFRFRMTIYSRRLLSHVNYLCSVTLAALLF